MEKLADHVGVIIDGKSVSQGTVEEIIEEREAKDLEDAFIQMYRENHIEEEKMIKGKKRCIFFRKGKCYE